MSRKQKGSRRLLGGVVLTAFLGLLAFSLALRHGDALRGLDVPAWLGGGGGGATSAADAPPPAAGATPGADAAPPSPAPDGEAEAHVRLQILNGTGVNRLAFETGERLRAWDVDALDRGNAPPWPFPETLLVVRDARRAAAVQDLARRLGGVPVVLQRREDLMVDATLLLGHDWRDYRWPGS